MSNVNGLEVTDVIIFPVKKRLDISLLKAFAKVVFNDNFIVNGIRIMEGRKGPYVSFPKEYSGTEGKSFDICFPVTAELRVYLTDAILSAYSITTTQQEATA